MAVDGPVSGDPASSPSPPAGATEQAYPRVLQLAVVVPVLNEVDNVEPLFQALTRALDGLVWEVIFVDDQSGDGTIQRIDALASRFPHVRAIKRFDRKGLSSAVVEGAMSSAAQAIAVIDGDMQHDESLLPAMFRPIADGSADMVVGTRYAAGGDAGGLNETRLWGSKLLTRISNILMLTRCSDPLSGFFVIRRDLLISLRPRLSSIGFKIVLDLLVSGRGQIRLVEQPFHFRARTRGESKMNAKIAIELLVFFIDKTIGRFLPTRLVLFMAVGTLGLAVHLAVLRTVLQLGQNFSVAQTAAVAVAIAFNFALNNLVTYADRKLKGWAFLRGLASFYVVCATGAIANVGVGTLVFAGHTTWWIAGIAGATVGAVWNYAASSLLTWKR